VLYQLSYRANWELAVVSIDWSITNP